MRLVIACLFLAAPLAAHGQLMKCIGKDGRVEYASQCPPGTQEIRTGIRNVPSASPPSAQQKSLAERDAEFRKRLMEREDTRQKEEKKTTESQEKRAACEQAQTYLKSLETGNRIARVDPKTGERVFLEDPDRPAEVAKARRAVQSNCN